MTETIDQRIQSLEQLLSSQPRTPLFAQLASHYLDSGRAQDALALCDKGLALHPFYSTAHLIKGKALLALNMNAEARREFEFVYNCMPGNDAVARLLRDLPSGEFDAAPASAAVETAPEAPAEEATPAAPAEATEAPADANADQWMSQFTEGTPETAQPSETVEEPAITSESDELIGSAFTPDEPAPEAATTEAAATEETFIGEPQPEQTGESLSDFSERKRVELLGLENTMSLDDYLASAETPASPLPEEAVAPESPLEEQAAPEAPTAEDPFAALSQQPEEATTQPTIDQEEDPLAALNQQLEESTAQPTADQPEDPFAALAQSPDESGAQPPADQTEDPFAQLSQESTDAVPQEPSASTETPEEPGQKDQIQELADKLQNAKKMTPVIDLSERSTTPASETDSTSSSGFVTPTLAEIYAKQGWYDDAIKAYRTLAVSKPMEKEKFEKRIEELEEMKKQQDSAG